MKLSMIFLIFALASGKSVAQDSTRSGGKSQGISIVPETAAKFLSVESHHAWLVEILFAPVRVCWSRI